MNRILSVIFPTLAILLLSALLMESLVPDSQGVVGSLRPLDIMFGLFRKPAFAEYLAAGIIVFAFVAGIWFRFGEVRFHQTSVGSAIQDLEHFKGKEDFVLGIDRFSQTVEERSPSLYHAWREFEKTLIRPERDDLTREVRNTIRPSQFFNVDTLVESGFHLPFWQALPNYFVGFGLLCTFLGLVSGLHFAAAGVTSDKVADAQRALQDLLTAATFKFLTSIAGILCSLGLSIFIRNQSHGIQIRIDNFCRLLEERLSFVSPEYLAMQQLREQQRMLPRLEHFLTEFGVHIADAINQRLTNQEGKNVIVAAIEQLQQTMQGISAGKHDVLTAIAKLQNAIQGLAGGVTEGISGAVIDGVAAPLQTLSESIATLNEATEAAVQRIIEFSNLYSGKITQASERFEAGILRGAEEIRNAANAATHALTQGAESTGAALSVQGREAGKVIGDAGRSIRDAIAPLQKNLADLEATLTRIGGTFSEYHARTEALKHGLDQSVNALRETAGNFERTGIALQSTAQPVRDATVALVAATERSNHTAQTFEGLTKQLVHLSESIQAVQSASTTAWNDYRERFEQTDEHLARTFQNLLEGIGHTHQTIQTFVSALDQSFGQALSTLNGGIHELNESVTSLDEVSRRYSAS